MRKVRCQSGLPGERMFLQENYESCQEFKRYDVLFNLSKRLGFQDCEKAWLSNPVIELSSDPSDFRFVKHNTVERGRY